MATGNGTLPASAPRSVRRRLSLPPPMVDPGKIRKALSNESIERRCDSDTRHGGSERWQDVEEPWTKICWPKAAAEIRGGNPDT
jgi:hypothetical protein